MRKLLLVFLAMFSVAVAVLNAPPAAANTYLTRWARRKYKRLRAYKRFRKWWTGLIDREPRLFVHWSRTRAFDWKG